MKRFTIFFSAVFLALIPCILSALAISSYTRPMEDRSYNLSLLPEDGQEWEGTKGWTVYTMENGVTQPLVPDNCGGYSGLSYPGQTVYLSRKMTEELDSPTLHIGAVNRSISVFLDDTLVYTDCPDLADNQIGTLHLPMQEYDRAEPVTVSLPLNYCGRTLTIAQSSPEYSELQDGSATTIYPCGVTLYCGYSYESGLISQTAKTMIPAVLLFALQLILLAVFLWNASLGSFLPSLLAFALTALFQMIAVLTKAAFFQQYFGEFSVDIQNLASFLSMGMLLVFLSIYAGTFRPAFLISAGVLCLSSLLSCAVQAGMVFPYGESYRFFVELPQITGFLFLVLAIICAFVLWNKGNRFFRRFAQTAFLVSLGYAVFLLVSIPLIPDYASSVISRIAGDVRILLPYFSLKLAWILCLTSSIATIFFEVTEREAQRRAEISILTTKNRLSVESYENLRLQADEVMMLRHDTAKHYLMLRSMAEKSPEKLCAYLDELVEQTQQIRPVAASGNEVLDIILNGKLAYAAEKGISAEFLRCEAPRQLPLHDTELCCLVMNILDNAISAASGSNEDPPYIRLDLHCKEDHFIFSCENSRSSASLRHKKSPIPGHGYGLKIIHQIMKRWGDMVSIEETGTTYKISVVIPLS